MLSCVLVGKFQAYLEHEYMSNVRHAHGQTNDEKVYDILSVSSEEQFDAPSSKKRRVIEEIRISSEPDSDELEDSEQDFEDIDISDRSTSALDLTLQEAAQTKVTGRKGITGAERKFRTEVHKLHLLCLLSSIAIRNLYANDPRVLKRVPKLSKFSRFCPDSSLPQTRQCEKFKQELASVALDFRKAFRVTKCGMRRCQWNESMFDHGDQIASAEDFMSSMTGSRDLGAQIFCAMLRAIGLDVRLVCSLQPLAFNFSSIIKSNATSVQEISAGNTSDEATPVSNLASAPIRLRKPRFKNKTAKKKMKKSYYDIKEPPFPIFWVEVWNPIVSSWTRVDPMVQTPVGSPHRLEPPASLADNVMAYVIALDGDGYATDVTLRYTKAFMTKTRKNRIESQKGGEEWWSNTIRRFARHTASTRELIEHGEFSDLQLREPIPQKLGDFIGHPLFALERNLRRDEALKAGARQVGSVHIGKEFLHVFPRSHVVKVKSTESWYRNGRVVKKLEIPRKFRRETQPLFAESQTDLYLPPPVVNGRVPCNAYRKIDIFVPSMLPKGAIHLKEDAIRKTAQFAGVHFAEAVTGMEFRQQTATPIVQGIVLAEENARGVLLIHEGFCSQYEESQREKQELQDLENERRTLAREEIKRRVRDEYGPLAENDDKEERTPEISDNEGGFMGAGEDTDHDLDWM